MTSPLLVRMSHMRKLRYCSRGVREFFRRHGLDYSGFLRDGIDGQKLRDTGDAMAIAAVEEAERERR